MASPQKSVLLASAVFSFVPFFLSIFSPLGYDVRFCHFIRVCLTPPLTVSTQTTVFFPGCAIFLSTLWPGWCGNSPARARDWGQDRVLPPWSERKKCQSPSSRHTSAIHLFLPAVFCTGILPVVRSSTLLWCVSCFRHESSYIFAVALSWAASTSHAPFPSSRSSSVHCFSSGLFTCAAVAACFLETSFWGCL